MKKKSSQCKKGECYKINSNPFIDFYERSIKCFQELEIEFVLVGGTIMPYYGNLRTTTDIDIMILPETLNEKKIDKFITCMQKNHITINKAELKEMLESNIHISAFDEKSWLYRLDLKIIQNKIDKITLENIRYANIYNMKTPIACPETMIAIKISDGYQSDNDLEDIISIIENNEIDTDLLLMALESVDAINNLLSFLKNCESERCNNMLRLLDA